MIIDRLQLENFGPYLGVQTFDLTPPSDDKPVVLIGGLNGGGKTTILEAILHALYGPLAGALVGREGTYEAFLRRSPHRQASGADETAVDLTFRIYRSGVPEELRIRRAWKRRADRMAQRVSVWRNGEPDEALAEGWIDFIEAFMPRGVARLFFFDGEKVEELADLERAQETLRTAVGSLLGVDIVDQLVTDLKGLERRHATAAATEDEQRVIRERAASLAESEERVSELIEEMAQTRSALDSANRAARVADDLFRNQGGELFEQRQQLEEREQRARTAVHDAEESLRRLAAGAAPLLLVAADLTRTLERAAAESELRSGKHLAELLESRDAQIANLVEELGLALDALETLRSHLAKDRADRSNAEPGSALIGLSDAARGVGEHVVQHALPEVARELHSARGLLADAQAGLEEVDRLLAQLPSPDAIQFALEQREFARNAIGEQEARAVVLDEQLERAKNERERRRIAHERALERAAGAEFADEDRRRLLQHSARARETLNRLHTAAIARQLSRIEEFVADALKTLLRKDGLIGGLKIDPESFSLELQDRTGNDLSPQRLSAGERQIVALALLWGLARAAGRPLPVVIDTPLGRLDSSHRHLIVERYLPRASHQVLVLSTDTEIEGSVLAALAPYVGHQYLLSYDETSDATAVQQGYFIEGVAA